MANNNAIVFADQKISTQHNNVIGRRHLSGKTVLLSYESSVDCVSLQDVPVCTIMMIVIRNNNENCSGETILEFQAGLNGSRNIYIILAL